MPEHLLEREQRLDAGPERTFAIFAEARHLQALTPPWLHFRVREAPAELGEGALIAYRLRVHGVPVRWLTRIQVWEPPYRFVDLQLRGPYELWHHTHTFEPAGEGTLIRDRVRYRIGHRQAGELAHRLFVRRDLERIFDYRHQAIRSLL